MSNPKPTWLKNVKGQDKDGVKSSSKLTTKLLEGSAKDMGNRKSNTIASFHDRGYIDSYVEQVKNSLGEKRTYDNKKGENKQKSLHPYYHHEVGDIVFPDEDGDVGLMSRDYVKKMQEIEDYIEAKVDYIMKMAIRSDQLCMDVLNFDEDDYKDLLYPIDNGGDKTKQSAIGMEDDMMKLNGSVKSIKATPAGSAKQVEKLSKLRTVVEAYRHRFAMVDMNKDIAEARKMAHATHGSYVEDNRLNRIENPNGSLKPTDFTKTPAAASGATAPIS